MEGSVLIDANLSGANLQNVYLEDAILTNANLTAANMVSTQLQNAYLYNTNLSGATLDKSELGNALLEKSQFEFASLGALGALGALGEFSNKVGVGDTVGRPKLDFAGFILDGASTPDLPNFSELDDMRNYMLDVLLTEELRQYDVA